MSEDDDYDDYDDNTDDGDDYDDGDDGYDDGDDGAYDDPGQFPLRPRRSPSSSSLLCGDDFGPAVVIRERGRMRARRRALVYGGVLRQGRRVCICLLLLIRLNLIA